MQRIGIFGRPTPQVSAGATIVVWCGCHFCRTLDRPIPVKGDNVDAMFSTPINDRYSLLNGARGPCWIYANRQTLRAAFMQQPLQARFCPAPDTARSNLVKLRSDG